MTVWVQIGSRWAQEVGVRALGGSLGVVPSLCELLCGGGKLSSISFVVLHKQLLRAVVRLGPFSMM